ncbi:MAG TPA: hypothetical protein VE526_07725, partial [Solirubrobacteraceae bacterium]|nr:hypothetical protein [Solirubrobacteraceae bacterium]
VAPTLLELAGLEPVQSLDGRSLAPALAGAPLDEADVVAEYLAEGVNAPAVMLRRGPRKYVACPGDPEQLYDLGEDPHELANLAPSGCEDLREEVRRRWDLEGLRDAVLRSQDERRLVARALATGRRHRWDRVPSADGAVVEGGDDLYAVQRARRLESTRGPRAG